MLWFMLTMFLVPFFSSAMESEKYEKKTSCALWNDALSQASKVIWEDSKLTRPKQLTPEQLMLAQSQIALEKLLNTLFAPMVDQWAHNFSSLDIKKKELLAGILLSGMHCHSLQGISQHRRNKTACFLTKHYCI